MHWPFQLLNRSENWTINKKGARRITATEMKYRRKRARCNGADFKTDTTTAKDLYITSVWTKYSNTEENGSNK